MSDNITLTGTTVLVDVGVDTESYSNFAAGLNALAQKAVGDGIPKVAITVDKIDATKALADFKSQLETVANNMGLKYGNTINTRASSDKSGSTSSNQEQRANQLAELEKRLREAGVHSDELKGKINGLSSALESLNDAGVDKWTNSFKRKGRFCLICPPLKNAPPSYSPRQRGSAVSVSPLPHGLHDIRESWRYFSRPTIFSPPATSVAR